jgi:hypothetical protein
MKDAAVEKTKEGAEKVKEGATNVKNEASEGWTKGKAEGTK